MSCDRLPYASRSVASSTSFGPSAILNSAPTMSFKPCSFAATWARTTPASEHSSVMASAA
jgi:hypothetical protein